MKTPHHINENEKKMSPLCSVQEEKGVILETHFLYVIMVWAYK